MMSHDEQPQVFNLLRDDALEITHCPYGSVGRMYTGDGLEAVWVKKEAEDIDLSWFSQPMTDLILVVRGMLRVEFERSDMRPRTLSPGELLVLPANTPCRAYRWPRDSEEATIFLAVYPAAE